MIHCIVLFFFIVSSAPTFAQWQTGGSAVIRKPHKQLTPASCPDARGGAFIVWVDQRDSGRSDLYTQRITAGGKLLWDSGGVVLRPINGKKSAPAIVSDDAGGAIIIWSHQRTQNNFDILAEKIDSLGNALWDTAGVVVSDTGTSEVSFVARPDDKGGIFIVWTSNRLGAANTDIYAQHISAAGKNIWKRQGQTVCAATGNQSSADIVTDGRGGVIISWSDLRNQNLRNAAPELYAQRIDSLGVPRWTTDGVLLYGGTTNRNIPSVPRAVRDGTNGAIIAWSQQPANAALGGDRDIRSQHVDSSGNPLWADSGIAVCTETSDQYNLRMIEDGTKGAIIAWEDERTVDTNIFAQRINSAGASQWQANGIFVCAQLHSRFAFSIIPDPASGAYVSWFDERTSFAGDLYAQHINGQGSKMWATNGVSICNANGTQFQQTMTPVDGGVLFVWTDTRHPDSISSYDIYAYGLKETGDGAIEDPVSIKEDPKVVAESIKVYPNPAQNIVSFIVQSHGTLCVIDALGKECRSVPVRNEAPITLDVSDFHAGVYFYSLTTLYYRGTGSFLIVH